MSLTGLFLCSFLVIHLSGNIALFASDGGQSFNEYTKFMTSSMLIRIMEIVLVLGFLIHIVLAVKMTSKNRASRPEGYAVYKLNETSTWYSRNMGITGTVILVFLILHLKRFWFEYKFGAIGTDQWGNKDMYTVVATAFDQWWYSLIYVVSMVLLGAHLNHGFQSAFRSLGLSNKKYAPTLSKIGTAFAVIMALGFITFPVVFYFFL